MNGEDSKAILEELNNEEIYSYAVSAYVFAHCAVWPDKTIDRATQQRTIEQLYKYIKQWSDLDEEGCIYNLNQGLYSVYKNAMLLAVNDRYWKRHPKSFISLVEGDEAIPPGCKQRRMKQLRKAVPYLEHVAATLAEGHSSYTAWPNDEMIEFCLDDLSFLVHYEWIRRFRKIIAVQKVLFADLKMAEVVEQFMNAAKTEQATIRLDNHNPSLAQDCCIPV